LETLKAEAGGAPTRARMPVNVKNAPSTVVKFSGATKSERISGSPENAISATANKAASSDKNLKVEEAEAMMKNLT
jgi:hypothetical protein